MNTITISSLLLGIIGSSNALKSIKDKIKHQVFRKDLNFELIEKISEQVLSRHIEGRISLNRHVDTIQSIQTKLLSGDVEGCISGLTKVFSISEKELRTIVNEIREEIIHSGSQELMMAFQFQQIDNQHDMKSSIEELTQLVRKTYSHEKTQHFTGNLAIKYVKSLKNDGRLAKALETINFLKEESLYTIGDFKNTLIFLEIDLRLKMNDDDRFDDILPELNTLSFSFEKVYYIYQILNKLNEQEVNIDEFCGEYLSNGKYIDEITALHDIKNNPNINTELIQLRKYERETQRYLAKELIYRYLEQNAFAKSEEIFEYYKDELDFLDSKFLHLNFEMNQFNRAHPFHELSISEKKQLEGILNEFRSFEAHIDEFSRKYRKLFYLLYLLSLIRKNNEEWRSILNNFNDDEKYIINIIQSSFNMGYFINAEFVLEQCLDDPMNNYIDLFVKVKFEQNKFNELSKIDPNKSEIDNDSVIKIIIAKNLNYYFNNDGKIDEDELMYAVPYNLNGLNFAYISRLFYAINNSELTEKYIQYAITLHSEFNMQERVLFVDILLKIRRFEDAREITNQILESNNPVYNQIGKLLFSQILRSETTNFELPKIEANKFFNEINATDLVHPNLIREKAEYFYRQKEWDKTTSLYKWICENYEDSNDWFQYAMILIDRGERGKAKKIITILQDKKEDPQNLINIGIIKLFTQVPPRIESFSANFLKAAKLLNKDDKIVNERYFMDVWSKIISKQVYSESEYIVNENTFVILKNSENGEIENLCIHANDELTIDFPEKYLDSYHLNLNNSMLDDLRYESAPYYVINSTVLNDIQSDSRFNSDIYDRIQSMQGEKYYNQGDLYDEIDKFLGPDSNYEIVNSLLEIMQMHYEVCLFNDEEYIIERVDSIFNYPIYFLSQKYYAKPEKYGLEKYEIQTGSDLAFSEVIPELMRQKNTIDNLFAEYKNRVLPFFILSMRNYESYPAAYLNLVSRDYPFYGGIGINFDSENYIISISSLIVMALYEKLEHIDLNSLVIPESLKNEIDRIQQGVATDIPFDHTSISIDDNLRLNRFTSSPDLNRVYARNWSNLSNIINQIKSKPTVDLKDNYTPFNMYFGKIEIDSIRLAESNKLPLIIDDLFIQNISRSISTSNFIPFYFYNSDEGLAEKIEFMNDLSKSRYRSVLFPGLISECIKFFIDEGFLFGVGSTFDNFIELIQRELNHQKPYLDIKILMVNELSTILQFTMHLHSGTLLNQIFSVIPSKYKDSVKFNLIFWKAFTETEREFLRSHI